MKRMWMENQFGRKEFINFIHVKRSYPARTRTIALIEVFGCIWNALQMSGHVCQWLRATRISIFPIHIHFDICIQNFIIIISEKIFLAQRNHHLRHHHHFHHHHRHHRYHCYHYKSMQCFYAILPFLFKKV